MNLFSYRTGLVLFMSPIFSYMKEWREIIELSKEYIDEY